MGLELSRDLKTLLEPIVPWYYQKPGTYSDDFLIWSMSQ